MGNIRIVSWDVETFHLQTAVHSLWQDSTSHENILKDWSLICVCWKDLGGKVKSVSVADDPKRFKKDPLDDYHVVKTIRDEFEDVDILVGHNQKRFDTKKFNARLIFHGLKPLPKIHQVDTLSEAKAIAAFTSNRLDYLGKHLLNEGKSSTSKGLWLECLRGSVSAVKEMVKYCKQDVNLLEKVYLKLRPYMKSHPNLATPETCQCPKCNSKNTVKRGIRLRASGIRFQSYQCNDCGGYFSDNKNLNKPNSKV